jgi:hypothetical protein
MAYLQFLGVLILALFSAPVLLQGTAVDGI